MAVMQSCLFLIVEHNVLRICKVEHRVGDQMTFLLLIFARPIIAKVLLSYKGR